MGNGIFQAPFIAFGFTMLAEMSPPGFDYMVDLTLFSTRWALVEFLIKIFGLYGISTTASSIIDPIILTAIIDRSGSNWIGFSFLFALCLTASLVIWFGVDVQKGRRDAMVWAEAVRATV
jgi:hypothetical protein